MAHAVIIEPALSLIAVASSAGQLFVASRDIRCQQLYLSVQHAYVSDVWLAKLIDFVMHAGEVGLVDEAPLALRGGNLTDDDIIADTSASAAITACALYNDASSWLRERLPGSSCTCYALVCRANGALEIFAVPEMIRVWAADDAADLPLIMAARDDVSSAAAGEAFDFAC